MAAAHDGAPFREHANRRSDARRPVDVFDDAIAVGANAQFERDTRPEPPPVLCEERGLDGGAVLERRTTEHRPFGQ